MGLERSLTLGELVERLRGGRRPTVDEIVACLDDVAGIDRVAVDYLRSHAAPELAEAVALFAFGLTRRMDELVELLEGRVSHGVALGEVVAERGTLGIHVHPDGLEVTLLAIVGDSRRAVWLGLDGGQWLGELEGKEALGWGVRPAAALVGELVGWMEAEL